MNKTPTQWQWKPDWRLWTLTLLLLPVLLGLGFWQVDRAQEKTAEREAWERSDMDTVWPLEEPIFSGRKVTLAGQYDDQFLWLLDNRTRDGRRGYELLQLFHPVAGEALVVNRGWLPAPQSRAELPDIRTPDKPVWIEARVAVWPEPPVIGQADPADASGWPRRVQSLNHQDVSAVVGDVSVHTLRLADADQPGALQADWSPDRMDAATHRGYALQWFSLAVVLLTLTIAASFRKETEDPESK